MNNETSLLEQVYSPIFEDSLLQEIDRDSREGAYQDASADHCGTIGFKELLKKTGACKTRRLPC